MTINIWIATICNRFSKSSDRFSESYSENKAKEYSEDLRKQTNKTQQQNKKKTKQEKQEKTNIKQKENKTRETRCLRSNTVRLSNDVL